MPTLMIEEKTFNKGMANLNKILSQHVTTQKKTSDMMDKIVGKLETIEANLHPLSSKTQPLIAVQNNIDKTVSTIDSVLVYFEVTNTIGKRLKYDNLENNPQDFFNAINKILESIEYVNRYPLYRSTQSTLTVLKSTLKQALALITNDITSALTVPENCIQPGVLPEIPQPLIDKIKTYIASLKECRQSIGLETYIQSRGQAIKSQMEFISKKSLSETKDQLFGLKRAVASCLLQYLKIIVSERQLAEVLLEPDDMQNTYLEMINIPLNYIIDSSLKYKELVIKSQLTLGEKTGIASEILEIYSNALLIFKENLIDMGDNILPLKSIKEHYNNWMKYAIDCINGTDSDLKKTQQSSTIKIPENATVHPITASIFSTVQSILSNFLPSFSKVLEHVQFKTPIAYLNFICSKIEAVIESFIATEDKKNPITIIFLINNLQYMHDTLLAIRAKLPCDELITKITSNINKNINLYYKLSFDTIVEILSARPAIVRTKPNTPNLTSESRRGIKAVFQKFIVEFNKVYEEQKKWSIPNNELRDKVVNKCLEILTVYEPFFSLYSPLKFSLYHIHLYINYPPPILESMIHSFFTESYD